jgi:hypothetical protein
MDEGLDELELDRIEIGKISPEIKAELGTPSKIFHIDTFHNHQGTEKHKNVYSLSLSCCGLTSLQNFPVLPNLIRVPTTHQIMPYFGFSPI